MFGKDYLKGVMEGLGDKAKGMIVSQQTFEVTDATVDSLMVSMKGSGIKVKTSPNDFHAVSQLQLTRFAGSKFETFGGVIGGN